MKSVPAPQLAEDYWQWQQHRVWRRINHERRGLARPLRQSFISGRFASVAVGLVVVAVVVIAGWRMMEQGSLGDVSKYLAMEKSAGKPPEAVAAKPTLAGDGARADKVEAAVRQSVDEAAAGKAAEEQGAGMAVGGRGGSSGGLGAASREPVVGALHADDQDMAATGHDDKDKAAKLMLGQAKVERPAASGAAGEVAPAPPVKGMTMQSEKPGKADLAPVLISEPILPEVGKSDTGTAVLRLTTDSLGLVTRAVVTRSSGQALTDSIALMNARASRFRPVMREGRPVGSVFQRQYRFRAAKESDEQPDIPKAKSQEGGH